MGDTPVKTVGTMRKNTIEARAVQEQNGNRVGSGLRRGPTKRRNSARLRARHLAGGVVGPVAVEPDDAPLDAPARADHAGILDDGIMDDVSAAIRDLDDAAAVAAWNGLRGPRAERGLANVLEIEDAQVGRPVHLFLLVERPGSPHHPSPPVPRRQLPPP